MEPLYVNDLVAFLESAKKCIGNELDVARLQNGDRVLVRTRNTSYLLTMTGPHTAVLTSDRADRPSGLVKIRGCVFGQSGVIKPDHLFCGGGLEVLSEDEHVTHTTSVIEGIQLVKASAQRGAA